MKNNHHPAMINIVAYYFLSVTVLAIAGLMFKGIFVLYSAEQFTGLSLAEISYALFWGLRFDLASAALFSLVISILLWLYDRLASRGLLRLNDPAINLLVIMLLIQMSLQISDTMYFMESGRHVSYEMRDVLTDASGLLFTALSKHTLFIILSYLAGFIYIFFVIKLTRKISGRISETVRSHAVFARLIKVFVVLIFSVIMVRGGVTGLPQGVTYAFKIGDAQQAIISMNGAYSVIYGALNSSKEITQVEVKLPAEVDIERVMRSLYRINNPGPAASPAGHKPKPYNLVFVLLEGWPANRMSGYGYDKSTTPFFDSLMQKSLTPRGVISGGVRTTEGIYAIFCSQQNPLGETVAQTSLQNFQYRCLPDILKQHGWTTAFFQGTHKETSGTGAFAQTVGFSRSYAKEDMPEPRYEHNYWGAHDPDIYDFVLGKMASMQQPFLVAVNTNSTHDVQVPAGVEPFFGELDNEQVHESILYFADQSLKAFFDSAQQMPFYKDTVFVIVSDHTGGKHKTTVARYFIPGLIYAEDIVSPKRIERYVSQRDLSPTVLDILGLPDAETFAGKSFLPGADDDKDVYFSDYFDSGTIGWLTDDVLVETSITDPAAIKCYSTVAGLVDLKTIECDAAHQSLSINALGFTSYSQNMLFEGRTKSFMRFKAPGADDLRVQDEQFNKVHNN